MEDFILREIDRIGELLCALLEKLHLRKAQGNAAEACIQTRTELAEHLDMDVDTLLAQDDFIRLLAEEHGFSAAHLEQFAELLAGLAAAAPGREEQQRHAAAACAIYRHLDAQEAPASFNRYYILKELTQYNR